jgi:hypothetical protein
LFCLLFPVIIFNLCLCFHTSHYSLFAFYSLRMFDYEDVTVGAWMLTMNVKHEDNRAMCDRTCTPSSIAVWDSKKCSGMPSGY